MKKSDYKKIKTQGLEMMKKSGLHLTPEEEERMEVTDFGLNNPYVEGLMLHVYVNTKRCCAKELPMLPGQTCAEHRHPPLSPDNPGKEETFRCRYGEVYIYVPGEPAADMKAKIPQGQEDVYTVRHEIVLRTGEQYTLAPDTKHWFQAGPSGAIVSEFSSYSEDGSDIFTDPKISRFTTIEED
ncbi:MAG: D-lyxose/D-mannose family sugar isomerase [Oscillospiraceae bacterium]|nr:D-lyxose/D-mannose family sugar isomerase [Oscillospiraceae bacterium]